MAKLSRKSGDRPRPVMNVTPLVDIVLVLLIIFMVVIPAMEKGAQIDLPSIFNVDEEAKSRTDPFTLSLDADGAMYFESERMAPEAFESTLREANQNEPARRLILRADTDVPYEDARGLFAIAQTIGFPGISLRVNQRGEGNDEEGR